MTPSLNSIVDTVSNSKHHLQLTKGETGNRTNKKKLKVQGHLVRMMVTHGTVHMSVVAQGRTEGLGSCVARFDDTGDVVHLDNPMLLPLLDCKVLDIDVTGAGDGLPLVDHSNGWRLGCQRRFS